MKLYALIVHTFRELFAKTILYILLGISTVVILVTLLGLSASQSDAGISVTMFGGSMGPPIPADKFAEFVLMLQTALANGLYSGIVLFGVFATASVIPDMLEKGTVDLYVSKPISRFELLFGKYLGAIAVMFANALYFIGALWLIIGIKLGVWNIYFLLSVLTLTFIFLCLYAIVVFLGVWTRTTSISIIGAFFYLFVVGPLLQNREQTLFLLSKNEVYQKIINGLYYLLPQISGIQENLKAQITGEGITWRPVIQAFLCAIAIFLGATEVLKRKDF